MISIQFSYYACDRSALITLLTLELKVMLHETIRNDDFKRNTALQHCFKWLQHCSNMATLCCAKNRPCESSRVTSPQKDFPKFTYTITVGVMF